MIDLTQILTDLVGNDGWSLLFVLFIVTFIDATIFPTLPEIFFVTILSFDPNSPSWLIAMVLVVMLGEATGIFIMWFITSRFTIPEKIKKVAGTYVDYLVIPNEMMVLINRFAPMLPFTGVFSAVMSWNILKVLAYNALGCVIKFGFLAVMGGSLYAILGADAGLVTIAVTVLVMILGVYMGIRRKRKKKMELEAQNENC